MSDAELARLIDGGTDAQANEDEVQRRLDTLRIDARARELFAQEEALRHPRPAPDAATLLEILARRHRSASPGCCRGENIMTIVAQRKTGKTTLTGNLFRSLLSGDPFLGAYDVIPLDGRVVALNYEVSGATYARWMEDVDGASPTGCMSSTCVDGATCSRTTTDAMSWQS